MRIITTSFMAVNTQYQAKYDNLPFTDTTESMSSCPFFTVRCPLSVTKNTCPHNLQCNVLWRELEV